MNPFHTFRPYFPQIHSNSIFTSTLGSVKWSLSLRFSDQNFIRISHLPMLSTFHAHLIFLDLMNLITFGESYKLLSSSLCGVMTLRVRDSAVLCVCSPGPEFYQSVPNFVRYTRVYQKVSGLAAWSENCK
jgi:hypothetical protein